MCIRDRTSASINPGNSGGGLFDQYGDLIGLVVAKSSGSDVEGLGFAIPVDKVERDVYKRQTLSWSRFDGKNFKDGYFDFRLSNFVGKFSSMFSMLFLAFSSCLF